MPHLQTYFGDQLFENALQKVENKYNKTLFIGLFHLYMKQPCLLTTITQPCPHRTSFHSHLQSTAYHYNSILNARAEIDNAQQNKNSHISILRNKHSNLVNAQRLSKNRKLLKSLVDIQRNYTLYGVRNEEQQKQSNKGNISLQLKSKRKIFDESKILPKKIKTLKNPYVQKMHALKISQQNSKLYQKIINSPSEVADKKQMSRWKEQIKYYSKFLDSSRQKQSSDCLKQQFYSTFVKMRQLNNLKSHTIRIQATSLLTNPQVLSMNSQFFTKNTSKKMLTEPIQEMRGQSLTLKSKKRRKKFSKKIKTTVNQESNNDKTFIGNN